MAGQAAVVDSVVEALVAAGKKNIPRFAKHYLSDKSVAEIDEYIRQCETRTSAEIMVCLVGRSSAIRHVPWVLSLLLMILFLLGVAGVLLQGSEAMLFDHWLLVPSIALFCPIVAHFLSRFLWVQRWLTADADEVDQVHQRALLEFYRQQLNRTSGGNAILIFISMMERRAVILAGESIDQKASQKTWDIALQKLLKRIQKKQMSKGITECCESITEELISHFPPSARLKDEVENRFLILDQ